MSEIQRQTINIASYGGHCAATEPNPSFVVEWMRDFAERGGLEPDDFRYSIHRPHVIGKPVRITVEHIASGIVGADNETLVRR